MTGMSRRRLLQSAAVGATALSASRPLATARAADLKPASLRLKWLPQAQFLGYYVAKAKGWYADNGIDLTINPGGPNIIAENMVGSGSDTFGHGGGDTSLLQAREKGLPIVGIGILFQETPYRFVALKQSGIKKFSDVKGKTVSCWFSGPQFMLEAMLRKAGINPKDVKIEPQAASMEPFIHGAVDMAIVTVYNEALVLKQKGVKPAVVFNPADMGVNIPNESLIVAEKTIKQDPKLVQGFLDASLRGWTYALGNRKEAIDILLKAAPNLDRTLQQEQLDEIAKLMTYGPAGKKGIGYVDPKALAYTNQFLVEYGVLKHPAELKTAVDTSFWDKVPAKQKMAGTA